MARNKFIGKRSDYGHKEVTATVKVVHKATLHGVSVEVLVLVLQDALELVLKAIEDEKTSGGRGAADAEYDYDVAAIGTTTHPKSLDQPCKPTSV